MKFFHRQAKPRRVAAHLVERHETVETIKGGVLAAFGHGRSGELLETHHKLAFQVAAEFQLEQVAQKRQRHRRRPGPGFQRFGHGVRQAGPVGRRKLAAFRPDIGAVHREAGDDFDERQVQVFRIEGASRGMAGNDDREQTDQPFDLGGEMMTDQLAFLFHAPAWDNPLAHR